MSLGAERERVGGRGSGEQPAGDWYLWGPYLSERQWGTVREDYSADGGAWGYLPHDHARSQAYRWGEDGLAGFSDLEQRLCLALALWNGRDPILKERPFGLTGPEGNHGEDVKEYPTGSGRLLTLDAVAADLWARLVSIFLVGPDGRRPCFGGVGRLQHDPNWKDNLVFNEYFHADNAAGLGAAHQTGWTGIVADIIRRRHGLVPSVGELVQTLTEPGTRP